MLFKRLGIDLGTANSLVYLVGSGVVLCEPTVVAVSLDSNRVVAVGNEAKEMLGRTPINITASRPMRDGVIADYVVTEAMLRYFLDRVCGKARFFKPEVMICVPAGCTQVERRAVVDAALSAGAREVYLIDEPLAASIGAGLPIAASAGNMIMDIGGGSTECAVISIGSTVVHHSVRVAGNKIDESIANYIRKKYNLLIGERTAEEIKIKIGNAIADDRIQNLEYRIKNNEPNFGKAEVISKETAGNTPVDHLEGEQVKNLNEQVSGNTPDVGGTPRGDTSGVGRGEIVNSRNVTKPLEVRGRDFATGLPRMITVNEKEISECIRPALLQIINCAKVVLEQTPPELSSDIIDRGITMAGGTSLLRNLDKLMTEVTGVPCHLAEDPLRCAVKGTGIAMENLELYKRNVMQK